MCSEALAGAGGNALDDARDQVRDELRRMEKAAALNDFELREWLADLATRLNALVRYLTERGVSPSDFAVLKELVDDIEAGGPVNPIWDKAVRVLKAFGEGKGESV